MTIVVTGATGNVGRLLVRNLHAAGAQVRAVTRTPDTARFPDGVRAVGSVDAALSGASAAFLNARALIGQLENTVETAKREGVQRLVALSAFNVDDDISRQPSRVRGERNKELEELVRKSGLEWVILRSTVMATNFARMWAPQIHASDAVKGPYARASVAPISPNDVAAVATCALLTPDLVDRIILVTGPDALTNAQLVEVIGTVVERPLRYDEMSPQAARERLAPVGGSAQFADAYMGMLAATLDRPAQVTSDVEEILARPAESFAQWVANHTDIFTT